MKRKIIVVITVLSLLFSVVQFSYVNASAVLETTFAVESVTKSKSSSTVNVNISVQNNPGIAGATLNLEFADGLELVSATNGDAFSELVLTKPGTFTNHCRFLWDSVEGEATDDGVILTLTFEVASDSTGDLGIEIYCNDGDVYNENLDTVNALTVNGVVKIFSQSDDTPESTEPTFEVASAAKSESSSTVDVDIVVKNNPGIAGATLNVDYAEGLTLIAATNGDAFSSLILTKPGVFTNHCRFLWDSVDGEVTADGVILTLTFEVAANATGDLAVCISCNNGDIYNESLGTVEMQTVNGVVKTSSQSSDTPEDTEPAFEVVSVIKSNASSTVNVDVVVKNNPGIAGATLNVEYAKGLTLIAAENGEAFSMLAFTKPGSFSNPARFLWDSQDGEVTANGVILTLTFEVSDNVSDNLDIAISCNDGDVYNENLDTVLMKTKNGTISITGEKYLFAREGSTTEIDYSKWFITGLHSNLRTLDEYISVKEGCEAEYGKTIGTGCMVNVKQSNAIVETYIIVIFGDVNGDGWYDGMDSIIVNCLANGLLSEAQVGEAVYRAADCNHDGVIDQADVELLNQAGVLLSNVDQTKSTDELLETSVEYVEYLNLIDQQTDADSDEATEDNTEDNKEPTELNLWNIIVKYFIALIKKIASVIKVF